MNWTRISRRMGRPIRSVWYRFRTLYLCRCRRTGDLGLLGERLAAAYLRRDGMTVVAHSARERLGEIDLVAVDDRQLVFVEVKTRADRSRHDPSLSIDRQKQQRLTRAARAFIGRHDLHDCGARFDFVAISWPAGRPPTLQHDRNAFAPVEND